MLRRFRWWDVAAAHAVEVALFPDPWSPETFWSELAGVPETRHYVVAGHGEALLGYAGLAAAGRRADVMTLAVAPAAQRHGIGQALLDALLAEAGRREVTEVLLDVRADNAAAQALYVRNGFQQVGVRRGYYRPGGTAALVLRLPLAGGAPSADA